MTLTSIPSFTYSSLSLGSVEHVEDGYIYGVTRARAQYGLKGRILHILHGRGK